MPPIVGTDKLIAILRQFSAWTNRKCTNAIDSLSKSFNTQSGSTTDSTSVIEISKTWWLSVVLRWATKLFGCGAIILGRNILKD